MFNDKYKSKCNYIEKSEKNSREQDLSYDLIIKIKDLFLVKQLIYLKQS